MSGGIHIPYNDLHGPQKTSKCNDCFTLSLEHRENAKLLIFRNALIPHILGEQTGAYFLSIGPTSGQAQRML